MACCKKCETLGTCCSGLGQLDRHTAKDALWTVLIVGAWAAFNQLVKMKKGEPTFWEKWKRRK